MRINDLESIIAKRCFTLIESTILKIGETYFFSCLTHIESNAKKMPFLDQKKTKKTKKSRLWDGIEGLLPGETSQESIINV